MKKLFLAVSAMLLTTNPIFADAITDGIGTAGDAVYSYTPIIQSLGYALAAIIGLLGAFVVYYAIQNNEHNVKKRILTWGGGTLAMVCMTIALPQFFSYQESGLLAAAGGGTTLGGGTGSMAGGDSWGQLDTSIPDLSDPLWQDDSRFPPSRPSVIPPPPSVTPPSQTSN